MSTAAEAIIEQVYAIQTAYFMTLAGCTLIIYDYTITFGREIDLFWRSKRSIALVLFHTIRYSMLLLAPIHLSAFGPHSEKSCDQLVGVLTVLASLRYIPIAVFSGMRAYALCQNYILSSLITTLSIIAMVVNLAQYAIGIHGIVYPFLDEPCGSQFIATVTTAILFPLLTRGGMIVADLLLIIITWRTLGTGSIRALFAQHKHTTFASILLLNGAIYFLSLLCLNILDIILFLMSMLSNLDDPVLTNLTSFVDPLTTILVYRLLMALQEANRSEVKLDSDDPLHISTNSRGSLSFARRAIGSIRATIAPRSVESSDSEFDGDLDVLRHFSDTSESLPSDAADNLAAAELVVESAADGPSTVQVS